MCSERKANGARTIDLVERAVGKVGHGAETFFARAGQLEKHKNERPLLIAAQQFNIVARHGLEALPGFEVPACVVRLAEQVHNHAGDPRTFFANLKA